MSTENLVKEFQNPPMKYRGMPFWAWNAKLEPEQLRSQIRTMKKMGMGGFFMHSRVGLKTPYLGKEWFDCIKACIDDAKKEGMDAWLYDEDRWPSGAAGGIVTADDRFKMKELLIEWGDDKSKFHNQGTTLACFAAVFKDEDIVSYRRIDFNDELASGETLVRCYFDKSKNSSEFNGQTYLDTMNEEAVKKFIDVTHEAYDREFKSEFGKTVPGIFTDEPCYALPYRSENNLQWTAGFEQKFQERYHYDLCDGMIELFFKCGKEFSVYRNNYYALTGELFVNAFGKQVGEWCEKHNLDLTGHVLGEDSLYYNTSCVGSSMCFYEYMQIPGIDLLTEHWTTYATVKQLSSVARQFGKKRRLSELYGCTGWDFPLFAHKSLGDWQYALGVNFRCHHLYWYSMDAEAKRDYPATISEHSPWYTIYSGIEDHFARVGSVISAGDEIRDILVIHPLESAWGVRYRVSKDVAKPVEKLNQEFFDLANTLLGANLDFDYGDEGQIARHGAVNGKIFTIARADYKAVVIPALKTIRSSTLKLLKKFAAAGGVVYYLGTAPEYVDAVKSDEANKVFADFANVDYSTLVKSLDQQCRRISLTDENGNEIEPLLSHFSEYKKNMNLFICNTGIEMSNQPMTRPMVRDRKLKFPNVNVTITAEAGKVPYEFNTLNGDIFEIPFAYKNGKYLFQTSFDELESRLFVLAADPIANAKKAVKDKITEKRQALTGVKSQVHRDEPNVFILDHADITVDGEEVKQNEFILLADVLLREKLGKGPRCGHMYQPYLLENTIPEKTLALELKYNFECQDVPETECVLIVEHPELYSITLNGTVLEQVDVGYWIDPVLRKLKIPTAVLKTGKNQLILNCTYHENLPGLESLFLLGEFGVCQDKICKLPLNVNWGDWCEQGFPAYGGNFTYRMLLQLEKSDNIFLTIPQWRGTAIGIKVNGSDEQILLCPPFRAEITPYLKYDGNDVAEICVYGHRRNVFGPFYSLDKWPSWTGPAQFKTYETEKRQTVPCGILAEPYIEIMKEILQ